MKKGTIAVLVVLALVLLVSPRVIGRIAEQSVNDSLNWADDDGREVAITASEFERGWFTSHGQHRIELLPGDLYYETLAAFGFANTDKLPVLVVDTRLDHGLIPVSSLARENGSLLPGLGSAVSELSLELGDASLQPLPIMIYTDIGLSGAQKSQLIIGAGGVDTAYERVDWGSSEFVVSNSPAAQSFGLRGALSSFVVKSEIDTMIVGQLDIDIDLAATAFGFMVGKVQIELDSVAVIGPENTTTAGPVSIESDSSLNGDRIDADLVLNIENTPMALGGTGGVQLDARLVNADALALSEVMGNLDSLQPDYGYDYDFAELHASVLKLLEGGMQLHIEQLDILNQFGQITSRANLTIEPSDIDNYDWATAMLLLAGSADISLPKALVDFATQINPELHGVIGLGYLRKRDDFYTSEASVEGGVLTINGAPMNIPLSGF